MAKAGGGEERESSLASGWTVHADPNATKDGAARSDAEKASRRAEAETAGPALAATRAPLGGERAPDAIDRSEAAADAADEPETERPQLSNAMLVVLGVVGGLYLLYAWIWLSWARSYSAANADLAAASGSLGAALQQTVLWFAPLAPVLWFLAVLVLNRRAAPEGGLEARRVVLWLLVGVAVLLPLPVFSGMGGV